MEPKTLEVFCAAEEAVLRLIEECGKQQPLYGRHPRAVAQVSRTARWLINAMATLHRALNPPPVCEKPPKAQAG